MIGNLNYVALAVPDLEAVISQYQTGFGAFVTTPRDLPAYGVRLAIVKFANIGLELISPLGDNSPLQAFLEKHPQGGLHHLCYEVADIATARDHLIANGIHVIGDGTPTLGYHGNPVLFFDSKDCLGALIELEEVPKSQGGGRVEVERIGPAHTFHYSPKDSLEGVDGIGIGIEVDFKGGTPRDNEEDN